uniref:G protein-coupled receptor n=1 Tax=Steinernema glaseri TaxID=37863 RepID=A0A1I7ZKG6_9BILA
MIIAIAVRYPLASIVPISILACIIGFFLTVHLESQSLVQSFAVGVLFVHLTNIVFKRLFVQQDCAQKHYLVKLGKQLATIKVIVVTCGSFLTAFAMIELQPHWSICSAGEPWAYRTAAATPFLIYVVEFAMAKLPSAENVFKLRITPVMKNGQGIVGYECDLHSSSYAVLFLCFLLTFLYMLLASSGASLLTCCCNVSFEEGIKRIPISSYVKNHAGLCVSLEIQS